MADDLGPTPFCQSIISHAPQTQPQYGFPQGLSSLFRSDTAMLAYASHMSEDYETHFYGLCPRPPVTKGLKCVDMHMEGLLIIVHIWSYKRID